jgi:hypothetical protein
MRAVKVPRTRRQSLAGMAAARQNWATQTTFLPRGKQPTSTPLTVRGRNRMTPTWPAWTPPVAQPALAARPAQATRAVSTCRLQPAGSVAAMARLARAGQASPTAPCRKTARMPSTRLSLPEVQVGTELAGPAAAQGRPPAGALPAAAARRTLGARQLVVRQPEGPAVVARQLVAHPPEGRAVVARQPVARRPEGQALVARQPWARRTSVARQPVAQRPEGPAVVARQLVAHPPEGRAAAGQARVALVASGERVEQRRSARKAQRNVFRVSACRHVRVDSGARRSTAGHIRPVLGRTEWRNARARRILFAAWAGPHARADCSPSAGKMRRAVSTSPRRGPPVTTEPVPALLARHRAV